MFNTKDEYFYYKIIVKNTIIGIKNAKINDIRFKIMPPFDWGIIIFIINLIIKNNARKNGSNTIRYGIKSQNEAESA